MGGVVVLGSLNMDLVLEISRPAGPGETREGSRFYTTPGGKGGNQAVAAARILGGRGPVTMVGRVGRDAYGDELIASLRSAGVSTACVRRDPSRNSGVAVILIDAKGENYVNAFYGANASCDEQQVADSTRALQNAAALLVQQEIPPEVTLPVMIAARKSHVPVILNPAPARSPLPDRFLGSCDILTPNAHEAAELCGFRVDGVEAAHRAAVQIRESGALTVVVTLGREGAWVEGEGISEPVPSHAVPVVATVGAGDAFNGALAAGLAMGLDVLAAVRLGAAAGALCVTRAGAQEAMPTLAEVQRLLTSV